jgi:hypothetical protein
MDFASEFKAVSGLAIGLVGLVVPIHSGDCQGFYVEPVGPEKMAVVLMSGRPQRLWLYCHV